MAHAFRERPADFELFAEKMTIDALHKHYVTGRRQIRRWLAEVNMTAAAASSRGGYAGRPVPDDFAKVAPTMSQNALSAHYGVDYKVIRRWAERSGVSPLICNRGPKPGTPRPKQRAEKPRKIGRHRTFGQLGAPNTSAIAPTSKTVFDLAADTLRRERFTVYRSNERGVFDLKGEYWRCGFSVLTGDELLARAAKYERSAA